MGPKTDTDAVAKKQFLPLPLILTQGPIMWIARNADVFESLVSA
jgi:hypothetical protein